MILQKTSLLGALIVAVHNGKRIAEVTKIDTDNMTVRDVTGQVHNVDFFVACKPPVYMQRKLEELGIGWTRNVASYIKRKKRDAAQEQRREGLTTKDQAAA